MAAGRSAWRSRLLLLVAIALYGSMVAGGILPNPVPALWDWINRERPLADGLAWQERLGARPASAATAGDAVAVAAGGDGVLRERGSGSPIGAVADWGAEAVTVAGAADDAVLVTSPRWQSGYEVRDPATGRVRHQDDDAVAVWGFRDARLDLSCDDRRACQLRSFPPGGADPVWVADLPWQRSSTLGVNPPLAGPRSPDPSRIHPGATGPEPMPPMLGVPVASPDGEVVVVVRSSTGEVVRELVPEDSERFVVVGGRVVRSVMTRHGDVCVSEVTGHDAVTGDPVWGPQPWHLWGTEGVGCEQRVPPLGGGAAVAVVGQDGRPAVLDAYDGRVLWTGERDERVDGITPERAVIRAVDPNLWYGVQLGRDGEPLWQRRLDPDASLVLTQDVVIVTDRNPSRVYVWDPESGENRLSVSTSARVLAVAPDGLLLAAGRSIGFVYLPDATPAPLDSK